MNADAYATALLLIVDNFIQYVKAIDGKYFTRDGGPAFADIPFSRIVRAATNFLRHGHNWDASSHVEDARVIQALGIDHTRFVTTRVFRIIAGDGYFGFEDFIVEALAAIVSLEPEVVAGEEIG